MCGIAGFLAPARLSQDAREIMSAMGDRLANRGPDGRGEWLDAEAGIALVHRRLAIIDLSSAGHQPMNSAGGRWVVSFNGEIYNHDLMRQELEGCGLAPNWRGHSDTETLLAAVEAWGVEATLRRAVGMFALALWDRRERALILVRDRIGEKPLYYGVQGGTFIFGSDLKALQAHPGCTAVVDRDALAMLLQLGYIPAPRSIYEGIRKLPPGTSLRISTPADAAANPVPYWSLRDAALAGVQLPLMLPDPEAINALGKLMQHSIEGQCVADVPLGAFLSGGIDSSLTVALMQARSSTPVRTFTIAMPDSTLDESHAARAIARHLGTMHTELVVTPEDALRVIPRLSEIYSEPFGDASQIPTFLVSQLARRKVTVSLSGDGGDELFGGYDRYHLARRVANVPLSLRKAAGSVLGKLPAEGLSRILSPASRLLPAELRGEGRRLRLQKLIAVLGAPDDDSAYSRMNGFWPGGATPVRGAEGPAFARSTAIYLSDFESRMMLADLETYLPDDILVKVDRAAMANSLETRVPMLDHRVVEFALRLPLYQKIRGGQGKWILRQLLERYVPSSLVDGPKKGFGIPIHSWLRGPLREWASDLLSDERLRKAGFIEPEPVRVLWHDHLSGRSNWGHWLWPILMFETWRST